MSQPSKSELIQTRREGDVAIVLVNNPPVNALGPGVAEGIVDAVERAAEDPAVRAIVVAGAGRTFVAGADIKEFGKIVAGERPMINLNELYDRIEDCAKPVIMAIHGAALGGGLELAMAGHYRVASRSAQVGQPEVKLGLIPGAGGTQRLPRLCGSARAMEMCALGEPVSAETAHQFGIVDELIDGDLIQGAVEYAKRATSPRRTRDFPAMEAAAEAVEILKVDCAKKLRRQHAPLAAIDAVDAAAHMPFEEGIAYEADLFQKCLYGYQSKALIHAFFAERAVSKIPGIPADVKPLPVKAAAVVGAGTMGSGIAMTYASAGIPVRLKDSSEGALERAMASIRRNYESAVAKGKLTTEEMEARVARITPQATFDGFELADVIVEAVFESMDLKKHVFRDLDDVARQGTILATNTSTLDVDEIASATKRPEWVVGHHFFSPANVMRLLEVVRGKETSPLVLATSMDLAKRLKKTGVLAGNCFGFVGNRMFAPYREEAVMLVEEGAAPELVDKTLQDWGMAMGPLAVGDLSGLDVGYLIRQEALRAGVPHVPESTFEDVLYARGRFGQKTGAGWYRYDEKRRPSVDHEVTTLLAEWRAGQAIPQREFEPKEIVQRTIYALVNEGARLLEEGIALRASDIDVVYLAGYGFPSWRGGPMHFANAVGLPQVLDTIEHYYDALGPRWKPAPLLERLAENGGQFE